jgi:hypothetical protein
MAAVVGRGTKLTAGLHPSGLALSSGFDGLLLPEGRRRLLEDWWSPLVGPTKPSEKFKDKAYAWRYKVLHPSSSAFQIYHVE